MPAIPTILKLFITWFNVLQKSLLPQSKPNLTRGLTRSVGEAYGKDEDQKETTFRHFNNVSHVYPSS